MQLLKFCFTAIFMCAISCQSAGAASGKTSFSKSVQLGDTIFDVSSRSTVDCAAQIVTVIVRQKGKKIATLKADLDQIPKSVQAADLTGDGSPELILTSMAKGETASEMLYVFSLDGTTLRQTTMPGPEDKNGYRGGDRFHIERHLTVRTMPVYRDTDSLGKPTGGTRTQKYEFKPGSFSLYVQSENSANVPADSPTQNQAKPTIEQKNENNLTAVMPAGLAITAVNSTETGIEIKANGVIPNFRTMHLDKPERIAIDIPGADSSLAGKKITFNRFGISKARVGRNKGFLRIVLDTSLKSFPKFEVKLSEAGLLIVFNQ